MLYTAAFNLLKDECLFDPKKKFDNKTERSSSDRLQAGRMLDSGPLQSLVFNEVVYHLDKADPTYDM